MKTIVGLFDQRSNADATVEELIDFGIGDNVSLVAASDATTSTLNNSNNAADGALAGAAVGGVAGMLLSLTALAIPGVGPVVAAGPLLAGLLGVGMGAAVGGLVGALTEVGVPEEQAGYYAEGVRRGGTLVSVKVEDNDVNEIVTIMNRHNPINVEKRASTWREEELNDATTRDDAGNLVPNITTSSIDSTAMNGKTAPAKQGSVAPAVAEDNNGYVNRSTAQPSMYGMNNYSANQPADAETEEVAIPVMPKEGRVSKRQVDPNKMHIQSSVDGQRQGQNGFDDRDFRTHYHRSYGNTGRSYDDYAPAYRYGYDLRSDDRYRDRNWNDIEANIRRDWSNRNTGNAWDDFKDAVRQGWERTKEAVR